MTQITEVFYLRWKAKRQFLKTAKKMLPGMGCHPQHIFIRAEHELTVKKHPAQIADLYPVDIELLTLFCNYY